MADEISRNLVAFWVLISLGVSKQWWLRDEHRPAQQRWPLALSADVDRGAALYCLKVIGGRGQNVGGGQQ